MCWELLLIPWHWSFSVNYDVTNLYRAGCIFVKYEMCFYFRLQFRGTEMVLELKSILLCKARTCSSHIINIVAADDLGTQGARYWSSYPKIFRLHMNPRYVYVIITFYCYMYPLNQAKSNKSAKLMQYAISIRLCSLQDVGQSDIHCLKSDVRGMKLSAEYIPNIEYLKSDIQSVKLSTEDIPNVIMYWPLVSHTEVRANCTCTPRMSDFKQWSFEWQMSNIVPTWWSLLNSCTSSPDILNSKLTICIFYNQRYVVGNNKTHTVMSYFRLMPHVQLTILQLPPDPSGHLWKSIFRQIMLRHVLIWIL